ncbi:unnamed protein product [Tenebrio molitor]|nr:unnamed protein product [Tenebrio molitor]
MITELWIWHSFQTRHGPAIGSTHARNLSDVAHLVYPAPAHYNIGNHLMHINNNKTLLNS